MRAPGFYAGVFLVAAASLVLQLVQTRILSVVFWFHLAFLVISLAMFGLAAGAIWIHLRGDRGIEGSLSRRLRTRSLGFATSTVACLAIQLALPPPPAGALAAAVFWLVAAVLGLVVSMAYGIRATLLLGAACYLALVLPALRLRRRAAASAVIVLGALALGGCGPGAQSVAQPERRPDILLVTLDTARADELRPYGGAGARTPNIDRLAAEGLVFEDAIAPVPETRPSHLTIFTSLYPRDHGVLGNSMSRLRQGVGTLPAALRDAGYDTGGFLGAAVFDAGSMRDLGFDHLSLPAEPQRPAGEVVAAAIDWLTARDGGKPFFLWVHLFDPHMPYQPPPPFNASAPDSPMAAWSAFTWPELLAEADRGGGHVSAELLARARDLYRGELELADFRLGELLETIERLGRWDDTLVALTADHGECFEDGVFFDHSQCLGEGALAVPLILRFPGALPAGERVAGQVELLDLAPSMLRLAGVPVPDSFDGIGLLERTGGAARASVAFFEMPLYRPQDVAQRDAVLARLGSVGGEAVRLIASDRRQVGVRDPHWKLITDGVDEWLTRLDPDAAEPRAVAARRLRRQLRGWLRDHPLLPEATAEGNPELVAVLKSLGYL